jgi:hypothetical protein
MADWEPLSDYGDKVVGRPGMFGTLHRFKVPGGYIYKASEMFMAEPQMGPDGLRTGGLLASAIGIGLTFVPDPK